MIRTLAIFLALLLPLGVLASEPTQDALELPSGQTAQFHEVLTNRPGGGLVYRFRFVAEGFVPTEDNIDQVQADLEYLCTHYAIGKVPTVGPQPRQIIISLADRHVEFGVVDPDAKQVFEAYSVQDGICIWEIF